MLQAEVADLRKKLATGGSGAVSAETVNGIALTAQVLSDVSPRDLPGIIDDIKTRGPGAVLLIADTGGKAAVAAGVTEDLTDRFERSRHWCARLSPNSAAKVAVAARPWPRAVAAHQKMQMRLSLL